MKANELRIGNWVKHNSEWCYRGEEVYKFQWNETDWYALGESTLFLENIEPIPLTEEWLIKFGFEKLWYDDNGMKLPYYRLNQNDYVFDLDYEFCATRDDAGYIYLKSVHQLQNLYFALTGDELEIK